MNSDSLFRRTLQQKYFADCKTSPDFPSVEGESFRFGVNFPIVFLSDYQESDQLIGLADL